MNCGKGLPKRSAGSEQLEKLEWSIDAASIVLSDRYPGN